MRLISCATAALIIARERERLGRRADLRAADVALCMAKRAGRDRVCAA